MFQTREDMDWSNNILKQQNVSLNDQIVLCMKSKLLPPNLLSILCNDTKDIQHFHPVFLYTPVLVHVLFGKQCQGCKAVIYLFQLCLNGSVCIMKWKYFFSSLVRGVMALDIQRMTKTAIFEKKIYFFFASSIFFTCEWNLKIKSRLACGNFRSFIHCFFKNSIATICSTCVLFLLRWETGKTKRSAGLSCLTCYFVEERGKEENRKHRK